MQLKSIMLYYIINIFDYNITFTLEELVLLFEAR